LLSVTAVPSVAGEDQTVPASLSSNNWFVAGAYYGIPIEKRAA
jgi:hypothetical protein